MIGFDPYRKWLGIPPEERPPTFYRLLGVSQHEADREAIEAAAERQSTFVRKFRGTEQDEPAALILFEIDQAKYTLLNAEARKRYDASLRQSPQGRPVSVGSRGSLAGNGSGLTPPNAVRIVILAAGFLGAAIVIVALPWEKLFSGSQVEVAKASPNRSVPDDSDTEPPAQREKELTDPVADAPAVVPQPAVDPEPDEARAAPIAPPVAAAIDAARKPKGNVALASSGASAVGANRGAEFMLDGRNDQQYAKLPIGNPCVITLAQTYDVTRLRFRMVDVGKRYYRYLLEVSADGRSYDVVADRRTGEHRGWQSHTFPSKPIGFIRLTGTHVSDGAALYVHEFEAYCD